MVYIYIYTHVYCIYKYNQKIEWGRNSDVHLHMAFVCNKLAPNMYTWIQES